MKKVLILTVIAILALGVMAMAESFENTTPATFDTTVTIQVAGWGQAEATGKTPTIEDYNTFTSDIAATLTVESNDSTAVVEMLYNGMDLNSYGLKLVFNSISSGDSIPKTSYSWSDPWPTDPTKYLSKTVTLSSGGNYGNKATFNIYLVKKSNGTSDLQNLSAGSDHKLTIYFRVSAYTTF